MPKCIYVIWDTHAVRGYEKESYTESNDKRVLPYR